MDKKKFIALLNVFFNNKIFTFLQDSPNLPVISVDRDVLPKKLPLKNNKKKGKRLHKRILKRNKKKEDNQVLILMIGGLAIFIIGGCLLIYYYHKKKTSEIEGGDEIIPKEENNNEQDKKEDNNIKDNTKPNDIEDKKPDNTTEEDTDSGNTIIGMRKKINKQNVPQYSTDQNGHQENSTNQYVPQNNIDQNGHQANSTNSNNGELDMMSNNFNSSNQGDGLEQVLSKKEEVLLFVQKNLVNNKKSESNDKESKIAYEVLSEIIHKEETTFEINETFVNMVSKKFQDIINSQFDILSKKSISTCDDIIFIFNQFFFINNFIHDSHIIYKLLNVLNNKVLNVLNNKGSFLSSTPPYKLLKNKGSSLSFVPQDYNIIIEKKFQAINTLIISTLGKNHSFFETFLNFSIDLLTKERNDIDLLNFSNRKILYNILCSNITNTLFYTESICDSIIKKIENSNIISNLIDFINAYNKIYIYKEKNNKIIQSLNKLLLSTEEMNSTSNNINDIKDINNNILENISKLINIIFKNNLKDINEQFQKNFQNISDEDFLVFFNFIKSDVLQIETKSIINFRLLNILNSASDDDKINNFKIERIKNLLLEKDIFCIINYLETFVIKTSNTSREEVNSIETLKQNLKIMKDSLYDDKDKYIDMSTITKETQKILGVTLFNILNELEKLLNYENIHIAFKKYVIKNILIFIMDINPDIYSIFLEEQNVEVKNNSFFKMLKSPILTQKLNIDYLNEVIQNLSKQFINQQDSSLLTLKYNKLKQSIYEQEIFYFFEDLFVISIETTFLRQNIIKIDPDLSRSIEEEDDNDEKEEELSEDDFQKISKTKVFNQAYDITERHNSMLKYYIDSNENFFTKLSEVIKLLEELGLKEEYIKDLKGLNIDEEIIFYNRIKKENFSCILDWGKDYLFLISEANKKIINIINFIDSSNSNENKQKLLTLLLTLLSELNNLISYQIDTQETYDLGSDDNYSEVIYQKIDEYTGDNPIIIYFKWKFLGFLDVYSIYQELYKEKKNNNNNFDKKLFDSVESYLKKESLWNLLKRFFVSYFTGNHYNFTKKIEYLQVDNYEKKKQITITNLIRNINKLIENIPDNNTFLMNRIYNKILSYINIFDSEKEDDDIIYYEEDILQDNLKKNIDHKNFIKILTKKNNKLKMINKNNLQSLINLLNTLNERIISGS